MATYFCTRRQDDATGRYALPVDRQAVTFVTGYLAFGDVAPNPRSYSRNEEA